MLRFLQFPHSSFLDSAASQKSGVKSSESLGSCSQNSTVHNTNKPLIDSAKQVENKLNKVERKILALLHFDGSSALIGWLRFRGKVEGYSEGNSGKGKGGAATWRGEQQRGRGRQQGAAAQQGWAKRSRVAPPPLNRSFFAQSAPVSNPSTVQCSPA